VTPKPHSVQEAVETIRVALDYFEPGDRYADQHEYIVGAHKALDGLVEQFETLQEKARRFLVVTSGPPERIEDVGKARRELVDALHISSPASRPE